ncbi:MAG TPA: ABC transporter ATP-binding protein [Micromonosporaceae bacterium]|jgi:ABC-2 type transport system ATP-binding protein
MADAAIRTEQLVKNYGRNRGLAGLDLTVDSGEVYGFLGPNGAGKTTTIRLLLDLIRPTSGTARVLGRDPRVDGVALRRQIGYLPGDFVVDGQQTGHELLTYLGNLRGGVPRARIDEYAGRLDLDLGRKIKSLSKGNRQKIGVVQAFMHSPDLLILDEPTSGLDPFLQQQVVVMIRDAKANGQTVFMSSHVMSEVQQTADRVGIIREGRLIAVERVEDLRERSVRRVEIQFEAPVRPTEFSGLPGVSDVSVDPTGTILHCRLNGRADALVKAAGRHTVVNILSEEPDLEELFFHYYNHTSRESSEASHAA